MKKITFGLATLLSGVAINSFAAFPAHSQSNTLTTTGVHVPYFDGGLTFGLAGLYLRSSTSEFLDYALISQYDDSNDRLSSAYRGVNPDHHLGYRVNIGYVFPGTGNDVNLSYTNYNNDKNDSTKGLNLFATELPERFLEANAKAKFKYQAVDLDFGQHINIGCNTQIRFFGGLRYADLESRFNTDYDVIPEVSEPELDHIDLHTTQKSEFHGIGPRFGVDTRYRLGHGFGVVGQLATALLVGESNNDHYDYDLVAHYKDDYDIKKGITYKFDDQTRVVPNLAAKLGLDYSYRFQNCNHTKVTLEAGYQVDHYFNSIDRLSVNAAQPEIRTTRSTIDTSFEGPYLGIQIHI
jgi:Legionella pneumophila major outer membrane protein precursor